MRVQTSRSNALVALMLAEFKSHLRILHTDEDTLLSLYLEASLESIGAFADIDIMETVNTFTTLDAEVVDSSLYTHYALSPISAITIVDSADADVSALYEIDLRGGYIYPSVDSAYTVTVTSGYSAVADVPAKIKSIVYRYGAHLYEHREAIQIGEPKFLPDWVQFAMASIQRPRV